MEFGAKLQTLRKQRGLTQAELAQALYVSRTAVSKWESGRGYPSIDSLKAIGEFFALPVDELLSGGELLSAAESDRAEKLRQQADRVFGLLDCAAALLVFLPIFGQNEGGYIYSVPLLQSSSLETYIKIPYLILIALTVGCGAAELALRRVSDGLWAKRKRSVSLALSAASSLLFIASNEPYAATFTFVLLLIKGGLLLKRP